ncbi:hypothetical protein SAMN02745221_01185 [Thermosyntropha lipolytica DSM 11003]|uniref:CBU-0592-like domain-containing protein n=1 Tax=Thermosyntropha lipolytica DSM 11003 TaxID=1123382 RepID=A0A1M5NG55_9FIRM|nr:hypothetical protein [Thermosyntropha lipolytica]SHG87943.1 hypothetical protein SAMN02745221_01185 [Thermosyntropha lipolytica DSM 11003]
MNQVIAFLASVAVLGAYALLQTGKLSNEGRAFNLTNFIATGTLAYIAFLGHQWGFLFLEGTWAAVSIYALLKFWRKRSWIL